MKPLLTRLAIVLLLAVVAGGYVWWSQHQLQQATYRATVAEGARDILADRLAAAKASEKIVIRYVDRVHTVHDVGATIVREVPVYVTPKADAACTVPRGFVRVHDAAAAGVLPGPAEPTDDRPAGLALSTASAVVVDNYTTCHAIAEQLIALRDWVRANQAPGGAGP